MSAPTLTREAWNRAYAAQIVEVAGMTDKEALECADCADTAYDDGCDPIDSADSEMSYWGD